MLPFHSSATTKISPNAESMTGVPVMPTVGLTSPHPSLFAGTGVARFTRHKTVPLSAASAYTESFSVATKTRPASSSGSPNVEPSRAAEVHAVEGLAKLTPELSTPDPAALPW